MSRMPPKARPAFAAAGAALASALIALGCGSGGSGSSSTSPASSGGSPHAGGPAASPPPSGGGKRPPAGKGKAPSTAVNAAQGDFSAKLFDTPTAHTNQWLPLRPGTQWVREGFVNVGSRRLPHRVVSTVTDVTKQVDGVSTISVLDQDFDGGQLAEQSIDYLANDRSGNVWYLGSYTEAYEGGQFVFANDAWLSGVNGAMAGVLMTADPQPGDPAFTEDTVPGVEAPTAQASKSGASQCVPFKCYKGVLVLQEGGESKYFAPGVGQIKVSPPPGAGPQEVENLVNLTHLSASGLAQISNEVLKLDRHAAATAPTVFANATPAKRTG